MSFPWNEFLVHAEELSGKTGIVCKCKESLHRTSISRAYYSVFTQVRSVLRLKTGRLFSGSGCHAELIETLKNYHSPNAKSLSLILKTMVGQRIYADYKADLPGDSHKLAEIQVMEAHKALELLKEIDK